MFDLRQFAALAPDWYLRMHYHHELDSTNDEARRLAEAGAEHGHHQRRLHRRPADRRLGRAARPR